MIGIASETYMLPIDGLALSNRGGNAVGAATTVPP